MASTQPGRVDMPVAEWLHAHESTTGQSMLDALVGWEAALRPMRERHS